jgi:hypothetical protein
VKQSTELIVAELRNVAEKIYLDHSIPNAALYAAADRLEELERVVGKLPKTKDGVPVVPGDLVWHPLHIGKRPCTVFGGENDPREYEVTIILGMGKDNFVNKSDTVSATECYSTREAALAAQEANHDQ